MFTRWQCSKKNTMKIAYLKVVNMLSDIGKTITSKNWAKDWGTLRGQRLHRKTNRVNSPGPLGLPETESPTSEQARAGPSLLPTCLWIPCSQTKALFSLHGRRCAQSHGNLIGRRGRGGVTPTRRGAFPSLKTRGRGRMGIGLVWGGTGRSGGAGTGL